MDDFLEMMPPRYANHADAFAFIALNAPEHPEVAVKTGPYGTALMRGMRGAVAALGAEGLSLVVDDVMLETEDAEDYRNRLSDMDVRMVGVMCAIDIAEQREQGRGDRMIGLARWQFERVHRGITYDLVVDTSNLTVDEAAHQIRNRFDL